jgi:vacuole morphology and inheritance protein 14
LSADPDNAVKNANILLDRLMKDIVTEDEHFDVEHFIPLIRERVTSNNPYVRQFLVGWIMILDSVPDINMIEYLPQFLHGLFAMLSDPNKEIIQQASSVLEEFLSEIEEFADSVTYGPLVQIIIDQSASEDDRTREQALVWIHKFLKLGQHDKLIPFYAKLVAAVLPSISHKQESIRSAAAIANKELTSAVQRSRNEQIAFQELMNSIKTELEKFSVPSRVVALNWLHVLLNKDMDSVMSVIDIIFLLLLKTLSDPSDEVVSLDLEVLAIISSTEQNFVKFLKNLVNLFRTDQKLLSKAGLIIRQLSVMLNPEKIYRELSKILQTYTNNLEFCSIMIQTLNTILLTSKELSELRELIKKGDEAASDLFQELYKSWCHNPVATLSLCLLAKRYKHASELVKSFSQIEVTVSFLVQMDNLVQLIESPVFAELRLQLLEPEKEIHLLKSLYGILMILPQSTAYDKLNKRLACVQNLSILYLITDKNVDASQKHQQQQQQPQDDYESLLKHFIDVQMKHTQSRNTEF